MIVGRDCRFEVRNGKVWCTVHETFAAIGTWNDHEPRIAHQIVTRPMQHVLYTVSQCETCNDGKVLIDEEV